MIRNKIIIGSANVNKRYGLINNKININEFKKLLNFAVIKGINTVDTSPQYSNSEKVIGSLKKNFKIVTKITRIPSKIKKIEIEKWITNQFLQSCKNLRFDLGFARYPWQATSFRSPQIELRCRYHQKSVRLSRTKHYPKNHAAYRERRVMMQTPQKPLCGQHE